MNQEIDLAKAQFYLTELRLQTEAVAPVTKEYKAPWLKQQETILRDQTGKFASGVSKAVKSVQDAAPVLGEAVDLGVQTIQSLLKDSGFRDRAGLAIGLPMAKMISQLEKKAGVNPEFTKQLDQWIDSVTKEIADQYGDDKDPMAQAIRKANIAKPPADASLKEKLEFHVAQYTAYKEALEKPEQYKKPITETTDLMGKAVKSLVPIGISLAFALIPEVGIPVVTMLAGGSAVIEWGTILTSVVVGEALDLGLQAGLDVLEVDNLAVRIGVGVLAGAWSGNLITEVFKNTQNTKRIAKEVAERTAKYRASKEVLEEGRKHDEMIQKMADEVALKHQKLIKDLQSFNPKRQRLDKYLISKKIGVNDINTLMKDIDDLVTKTKALPASGDLLYHADYHLDIISRITGFNKKPKTVSEAELDKLVARNKSDEQDLIYRGMASTPYKTGVQMAEEFKNGYQFAGRGVSGNGTYTAYGRYADRTAESYASSGIAIQLGTKSPLFTDKKEGGAIMRLFIDKKAKIIPDVYLPQVQIDLNKWAKKNGLLSSKTEQILKDPGRMFSLLGIDVIQDKGSNEFNILNRGVVIVQENLHDVLEDGFVR